jgi:prophage regulatory protein
MTSSGNTTLMHPDSSNRAASIRYVRDAECRALTGLSRSTRWRLERDGKFPQRRRLATRAIGWIEAELLEWMRQREVSRTGRGRSTDERSMPRQGGAR